MPRRPTVFSQMSLAMLLAEVIMEILVSIKFWITCFILNVFMKHARSIK